MIKVTGLLLFNLLCKSHMFSIPAFGCNLPNTNASAYLDSPARHTNVRNAQSEMTKQLVSACHTEFLTKRHRKQERKQQNIELNKMVSVAEGKSVIPSLQQVIKNEKQQQQQQTNVKCRKENELIRRWEKQEQTLSPQGVLNSMEASEEGQCLRCCWVLQCCENSV